MTHSTLKYILVKCAIIYMCTYTYISPALFNKNKKECYKFKSLAKWNELSNSVTQHFYLGTELFIQYLLR